MEYKEEARYFKPDSGVGTIEDVKLYPWWLQHGEQSGRSTARGMEIALRV